MRVRILRATFAGAAVCLLGACVGHTLAPPSTDIDETEFREAVRTLASDAFEGRKPGTSGEDKTLSYLVEQFKKLGLKPGNGASYLQQVPMVEILAGSDATLSISGGGAVKSLAYGTDMVIWSKRVVPQALLQDSALVFVGYGIVAPEYHWNDYAQVDVRGKTVLILVNDPGFGSKDPRVFKGNAETRYGRWAYKVEEATRHGAAGVLLIHDADAAGYGWNVVVNDRSGPQLERITADDGAGRALIEGWVSAAASRALFAQAGLDYAALTAAAARPAFKPVVMSLTVDSAVNNAMRRFSSANVIALLPGSRRNSGYVIYGAHWDHLGRQSAQAGGGIFSGAVDDASGVAGLLMLARSFKRTQPVAERSLLFVAFTGEEAGLLGSAYYLANPLFPLRETVALLNLDALHIGGPTRDVMVFGYGNSELEEDLRQVALLQGKEVHPDPNPELGMYFRSAQFSFATAGIPALYANGGIDDSARGPVWGQAQLEDYRLHRYHQTGDKYSADWNVRGTIDDLTLYYEVGNRLARSRQYPRWYPTSEFRTQHAPAADGSAVDSPQ